MYCRKVPLLQVLKYMPASVELNNAIAISNAAEIGHGATIENGIVIETNTEPHNEPQQMYQQEQFDKAFQTWAKLIQSGKQTAENVIKTAESKYPLTDDQKAKIRGVQLAAQDGEIRVRKKLTRFASGKCRKRRSNDHQKHEDETREKSSNT